jgi:hypothetical protein
LEQLDSPDIPRRSHGKSPYLLAVEAVRLTRHGGAPEMAVRPENFHLAVKRDRI